MNVALCIFFDEKTITPNSTTYATEQMAGYGRHKTTFQRGGYELLREELKMEVGRLWTRNLGRDDRCLSDHGVSLLDYACMHALLP